MNMRQVHIIVAAMAEIVVLTQQAMIKVSNYVFLVAPTAVMPYMTDIFNIILIFVSPHFFNYASCHVGPTHWTTHFFIVTDLLVFYPYSQALNMEVIATFTSAVCQSFLRMHLLF